MGVSTTVSFGYFCELRQDLEPYSACEQLAEHTGNQAYNEMLSGTDPMTGEYNHICVFNKRGMGSRFIDCGEIEHEVYDLSATTPNLPEASRQFVEDFKALFGDDSITVRYGVVAYAH